MPLVGAQSGAIARLSRCQTWVSDDGWLAPDHLQAASKSAESSFPGFWLKSGFPVSVAILLLSTSTRRCPSRDVEP